MLYVVQPALFPMIFSEISTDMKQRAWEIADMADVDGHVDPPSGTEEDLVHRQLITKTLLGYALQK